MINITKNQDNYLALLFLRLGICITLFYAAISAFLNPTSWIGFIPVWTGSIIDGNTFLHIHSIFNIFLGFWLLSNKKVFYPSIIVFLLTLFIILFNLGALDILFRDIAILFSSIALAILAYKDK